MAKTYTSFAYTVFSHAATEAIIFLHNQSSIIGLYKTIIPIPTIITANLIHKSILYHQNTLQITKTTINKKIAIIPKAMYNNNLKPLKTSLRSSSLNIFTTLLKLLPSSIITNIA
jgi:hypothetical protein